jgi:hypothetical protein
MPVVRDALENEIGKLQREYARERAVEIAKEKARRKAAAETAKSLIGQRQITERPVVESNPKVSPAVLQTAQESASKQRRVQEIRDEPHHDDYER